MTSVSPWADDRVTQRFLAIWHGNSASQVAAILNAEFGTSISRNAVIGKATRMGISGDSKTVLHNMKRAPREKKEQTHRPVTKITRAGQNCFKVFQGVATDMPSAPPVEVEPLNITLNDLTDNVCHAITQDGPDWRYCGHKMFKRSYCCAHFLRYYNLPEKRFGAPGLVAEAVA